MFAILLRDKVINVNIVCTFMFTHLYIYIKLRFSGLPQAFTSPQPPKRRQRPPGANLLDWCRFFSKNNVACWIRLDHWLAAGYVCVYCFPFRSRRENLQFVTRFVGLLLQDVVLHVPMDSSYCMERVKYALAIQGLHCTIVCTPQFNHATEYLKEFHIPFAHPLVLRPRLVPGGFYFVWVNVHLELTDQPKSGESHWSSCYTRNFIYLVESWICSCSQ